MFRSFARLEPLSNLTMTNHIIQEVRDARAALAAEHAYDHRKIFAWAKAAHAARQQDLSKNQDPNKARIATARKQSDKIGQQAAAPSL